MQRQNSVANPQGNNINILLPKKYLHLSGIVNFCDCNSNRKPIDFYRKYRNFKSIFHAKTAEKNDLSEILKAILVKTLGKYYLQLSSIVNFFECNVIQKILDFYLKYSIFLENFSWKNFKKTISQRSRDVNHVQNLVKNTIYLYLL